MIIGPSNWPLTLNESFAKLFGITSLDDPQNVNAKYPHTLQDVGKKLGYENWNGAHKLIEVLKDQTGFDMKESDNLFHFKLMTGKGPSAFRRKYSEAAVVLLDKVQSGEAYKLPPSCLAKAKIV